MQIVSWVMCIWRCSVFLGIFLFGKLWLLVWELKLSIYCWLYKQVDERPWHVKTFFTSGLQSLSSYFLQPWTKCCQLCRLDEKVTACHWIIRKPWAHCPPAQPCPTWRGSGDVPQRNSYWHSHYVRLINLIVVFGVNYTTTWLFWCLFLFIRRTEKHRDRI